MWWKIEEYKDEQNIDWKIYNYFSIVDSKNETNYWGQYRKELVIKAYAVTTEQEWIDFYNKHKEL